MEYFELFDMPVSFYPDMGLLKKRYFQKSREYHPDFFTQASDEDKQYALNQTSLINTAFKTLQDEQLRFKYLLLQEDIIKADEKDKLPQDFLFEMMEINEELEELLENPISEKLLQFKAKIDTQRQDLKTAIEPILVEYPKVLKDELLLVRDYFFKTKYLNRIREKLIINPNY